MKIRIAVHASHRAMEHYVYSLLPDITFLRSGPDGKMHLRDLPSNCQNLGSREKVIAACPDMAIARSAAAFEWYREHDLPTLWYLSGPPQPGQIERRRPYLKECQVLLAYSKEHAEQWSDPEFPEVHVCRYPIDTNVFKGYTGHIAKALMIATMKMSWWGNVPGDWKGTSFFKHLLDEGLPYQLIGFNNDEDGLWLDDTNPYPINDEGTMVECLAAHRVYGHSGTFLCRSPLEAMAVGAPVVIRQTNVSHYFEELPHGCGVWRAETESDFVETIADFLAHPDEIKEFGMLGRQAISEHFNYDLVRRQWMEAIEACLNG